MKNHNLAKWIMLSLALTTVSYGEAGAAPIASGTYDIGGTINLTDNYVRSTGDVTLNATSDVDFHLSKANSTILWAKGNDTNIRLNMNNHSVSFGDDCSATTQESDNSSICVLDAYDMYATAKTHNIFHGEAARGSTVLQANHDFTMQSTSAGHPAIWLGNGNNNTITVGHDASFTGISNLISVSDKSTLAVNIGHDMYLNDTSYPDIAVESKGKVTMSVGHTFTDIGRTNPILVQGGSSFTLTAGQDINTTSTYIHGGVGAIDSQSNLHLTAEKGEINILSTGGNTTAVSSDNGADVTLHAAKDITVGGNAKRGLRANGGTMDVLSDTGVIRITAANATDGTGSHSINAGIYAGTSGGTQGTVTLQSDTMVSAVTRGVHANNGAVIFAKNATITGAATGIEAANAGVVTVNGDTSITSTTANITSDKSTVTLAKAATLSGATTAIAATDGGTVAAMDTASAKKITGNITSDGAGSSVDANFMTGDSYLTGATTAANDGAVNLAFTNGTAWNVTGTSSLTNLVNNGIVNLRYTGNNANETITTANLSGNGTYIMNTDLQASYDTKNVQNNGDKIIITNSSGGSNVLGLRDVGLDTKKQSRGYLLLVEDRSKGSATFTAKDLTHSGIFKYKPVIVTDDPADYTGYNAAAKNWYLTGFEPTIEISDNTAVTLGLSGTRYANYFLDNDTLLKRLGELRLLKDQLERDGIWVKYRHGGMSGDGFDGAFSTVQGGYDKKHHQGSQYAGMAFAYTRNSYDFAADACGEGGVNAFSLYNTWFGDKGHYLDVVAKVGKMHGNSKYTDSLYAEQGEYSNWFYSLSGEYGRKIMKQSGFYYEPQAQLTWGRINGDDYTTSLGTKIHEDGITSVLSRVGVTVGKEYNRDKADRHSNIYGKVNWLHEWNGDVRTNLTDAYGDSYSPTEGYGGTWWNVGIGATMNLNTRTHLYVDLEKNFSGKVTTSWIGQVGCRWTW